MIINIPNIRYYGYDILLSNKNDNSDRMGLLIDWDRYCKKLDNCYTPACIYKMNDMRIITKQIKLPKLDLMEGYSFHKIVLNANKLSKKEKKTNTDFLVD